jgi:hypothetical protein
VRRLHGPDGRPGDPRSCSTPVSKAAGRKIVTLEGLGTSEKPHPIQKAFIEEQAVQCGYCINGMIMTSKALLDKKPNPLTFPDVPEIDIVLIDRPKEPPWGVGEPAAAVVPSAISNAVFDAIGVRLRTVPYTPERVKAAMKV